MSSTPETYFRKGFGLRTEVQGDLTADYAGWIVDVLREREGELTVNDVTVRIAREFGFCYGVERAVEYAYQTRRKFPDRRIFLVGEIIHNPHVNEKLRRMGIHILEPRDGAVEARFDFSDVQPVDVVVLPAFGVTIHDFQALRALGCLVVDTTCGSVLNVWKRVESYARDGFTALIHGKWYHEETRATASQVSRYPDGRYVIVRDMEELRLVTAVIEQLARGDSAGAAVAAFERQLGHSVSPGFDARSHLERVGVANQTTMLARESLAIAAAVGDAMERAYGAEHRKEHFRTFDTICSATQDRQDAVLELLHEPLDAMVVVGGFNSSNTISLAALCAERVPTYHVEDATNIDVARGEIRFRPVGRHSDEETRQGWLPVSGAVRVGITAGASTPNNRIGEAVSKIFATRGIALDRRALASG